MATASVQAQQIALSARSKDASAQAEHDRGAYAGVKPGGAAPPGSTAKPGARPTEITWPGFQMQPDGSSRVFLQSTTPIDAQPSFVRNSIQIDLGDVRIVGPNRWALYTQYFNSPVLRVEIKRAKKHRVLEIALRSPVQPRISSEQASSGYHFLYLDFPAGNYLPNSGAHQAPPPPTQLEEGPPAPSPPAPSARGSVKGSARAGARVDTSMDHEVPPGMAKPKAKAGTKAGGSFKIGN
jgi:hypothetical protein